MYRMILLAGLLYNWAKNIFNKMVQSNEPILNWPSICSDLEWLISHIIPTSLDRYQKSFEFRIC
jgi:hypothetical protein